MLEKIMKELNSLEGSEYSCEDFYELELEIIQTIGNLWGDSHIFIEPDQTYDHKTIYRIYPDDLDISDTIRMEIYYDADVRIVGDFY